MFEKSTQDSKLTQLKSSIDTFIIDRCRKFGSEFHKVLERSFDEHFKKTPNGIPRDWAPGTDIQSIFVQARDSALGLLNISKTFELEGNDDLKLRPIKEKLIDAEKLEEIKESFDRYADNEFRSAEERMRRREHGGILPTHPVQWLVLLFFAWNEIWAMLKNPLLLLIFIVVGMILFVAYQAHILGFNVQQVVVQMGEKGMQYVTNQLSFLQQRHESALQRTQSRGSRNSSASTASVGSNSEEGLVGNHVTPGGSID